MANAGPIVETVPPHCPSGHEWIVPRPRGTAPTVLIGSRPCSCTASGGKAHRTFFCGAEGCPTPWVLRPACSGDGVRRSIHTLP